MHSPTLQLMCYKHDRKLLGLEYRKAGSPLLGLLSYLVSKYSGVTERLVSAPHEFRKAAVSAKKEWESWAI